MDLVNVLVRDRSFVEGGHTLYAFAHICREGPDRTEFVHEFGCDDRSRCRDGLVKGRHDRQGQGTAGR